MWKTKGMNQDMSVSAFDPEFAFENMNLRLSTNEGNTLMSWVNEKGTSEISLKEYDGEETPGYLDGVCIGTAVLNEYLVMFMSKSDLVDHDCIYRLNYNEDKTVLRVKELYKGNLNFDVNHPIETLVSYESEHIQKVYWTDHKNQPRLINIAPDNDGKTYTDTSFDFVPTLELKEDVKVVKVLGGGGTFAPGVIQYAFTYYNKHGQESNIFHVTPLYYLSHKDRGASPEEKVDNTFKITVTGLDTHFDYLRIYSIQRTSIDATPICKRIQDIEIEALQADETTGVKTASYIDTGTSGNSIDPTELLYKGGSEINIGTMGQKDGTLFMGDITLLGNRQPNTESTEGEEESIHITTDDIFIEDDTRSFYVGLESSDNYVYGNQLNAVNAYPTGGVSVPCSGFKHGDWYRCGIQLQDSLGRWTDPIFLDDIQIGNFPSITNQSGGGGEHSDEDLELVVRFVNTSGSYITMQNEITIGIEPVSVNSTRAAQEPIELTVNLDMPETMQFAPGSNELISGVISQGRQYTGSMFVALEGQETPASVKDADGNPTHTVTIASWEHVKTVLGTSLEVICTSTTNPDDVPVPVPPEPPTPTGLLYKVGIISDIHMDIEDTHNSEYEEDLRNALQYFKDNNVGFVAACGDICQRKDLDYESFYNAYNGSSLNLFTCMGNHDYQRIYQVRDASHAIPSGYSSAEEIWQRNVAVLHGSESSLSFFSDTSKGRLSYWFEKEGDIFVFMSIDYGTSAVYNDVIRGINYLDYNDADVQSIMSYISDTGYDRTKETRFDYQYYNPKTLLWLKDILESNQDKRVFVFSHHFMPHKAGDSDCKYSRLRIWPVYTDANNLSGSNSPSGMTFWFLNKLNNEFKNAFWFSGHSHRMWEDGISICNHDYAAVSPTGNETTPPVNTNWNDYKDTEYDYKLYSRLSNSVTKGSGAWVGLPSLAKPDDGTDVYYQASQGAVLEVYSDKVVLKEIYFKRNDSSTYENSVIKEVTLASGSDPASDDDTKLAAVYNSCKTYPQDNTIAFDHRPTADNPGFITFNITNNSSKRILYNGRFCFHIADSSQTYGYQQCYGHFREPNSVGSNSEHFYYVNPTNYVLEKNASISISVPIKRYVFEGTAYIQSLEGKSLFINPSLQIDYFRLYFSHTEEDDVLHNGTIYVDQTGISDPAIATGKTFNLSITDTLMQDVPYYLPDGEDYNKSRQYVSHTSSSSKRYLLPMRLSDWNE